MDTQRLMSLKNAHVENTWHMYMMQPGDATAYRFGFMYYPEDEVDTYIIDSGVDPEEFIKFYIQTGYSTGISCCRKYDILHFPEQGTHILGYLKGHGMSDTVDYTLIAVLLALKILIIDPDDVDRAAKYMLDARKVICDV